jgi:DNA-binding MarR family transcriptional regulator
MNVTDVEKTQFAQELAQVLMQLKRAGWQHQPDQKVRQSEFRLLMTLSHGDANGLRVSEVSAHMQVTPAAVTHMLNPLEEGGYIERLADPTDRRVVLVKLTETGQYLIAQMKAHILETLAGLVTFLGERDAREFLRLLTAVLIYFKDQSKSVASA